MRRLPSDQTRLRILEATLRLLRRHGKDRLAIVDIARDLGMSHANIYRFFRNKTELLDAVVKDWLTRVEAFVRESSQGPGTAGERIEGLVVTLHQRRRRRHTEDPEVYEAFRDLFELRPDAAEGHRKALFDAFRALLAEGVQSGEFRPMDLDAMATVLKDATTAFLHPVMIPILAHATTTPRAREVVRCVLASLASTPGPAGPLIQVRGPGNRRRQGRVG